MGQRTTFIEKVLVVKTKDVMFHRWLIGALLGICLSMTTNCVDSASFVKYELRGYKLNLQRHFRYQAFSSCLVLVNDAADDWTVNATCATPLDASDVDALQRVWGGQRNAEYLDIGCGPQALGKRSETMAAPGQCVCGVYKRSRLPLNGNTTIHPKPATAPSDSQRVVWPCSPLRMITEEHFRPFSGVSVLSISGKFSEIHLNGAHNISWDNLDLLDLHDMTLMTPPDSGQSQLALCSLPSIRGIAITKSFTQKQFPTHLFAGNTTSLGPCPALLVLQVQDNHIEHLQADFLPYLGALYSLQLQSNSISSILEEAFSSPLAIHELSLHNNLLTAIPRGLLYRLTQLRYVDLSFNQISSINVTAVFGHLKHLIALDLHHNHIVQIEGSFKHVEALTYLNISYNQMATISNHTFQGCVQLGKLRLSHNNISQIVPGALTGMLFLQSLVLSFNQLTDSYNIRSNLWGNLENLVVLQLDSNRLTELLPSMFQQIPPYMSRLRGLDLSRNSISSIHPNAFIWLETMTVLALEDNLISSIDPSTFQHMNLIMLFLSGNHLQELPEALVPVSLQHLTLGDNQLARIPSFNFTRPNLRILSLTNNSIRNISVIDFLPFPNLQHLDLSHNKMTGLTSGNFRVLAQLITLELAYNQLDLDFTEDIFQDLSKLTLVNLTGNQITTLNNLFLNQIRFVTEVGLSHNPVNDFPDQPKQSGFRDLRVTIGRLYLAHCNISTIEPRAFKLAQDLIFLDLRGNRVTEMSPLEISPLSQNYRVNLHDNPLLCSCRMPWLKNITWSPHYDVGQCRVPFTNDVRPLQDVTYDNFLCKNNHRCLIDAGKCTCFAEDSQSLETTVVDCSYRRLTEIPARIPASTKVLHLGGNKFPVLSLARFPTMMTTVLHLENSSIQRLSDDAFVQFPYLRELYLEGNSLVNLTSASLSFLIYLQVLHVGDNSLVGFEASAFEKLLYLGTLELHNNELSGLSDDQMATLSSLPRLSRLTLDGNPWLCPCDNATFKTWLLDLQESIPRVANITCNGTSVLSIRDTDLLCYDDTRLVVREINQRGVVAISTSLVLVTVVIIVVFLVLFRNRVIIEVIVYNQFGVRFHHAENAQCLYDAFAAYDENDLAVRQWVKDVLIDHLEPRFRLFIPDRDFLCGIILSDAIVETIAKCRRTVFLVSPQALNNGSLLYTFQAAYHHMTFEDSTHQICVVLLDGVRSADLIDDPDLDPHLKAMLKLKQHLVASSKRFWEKLAYFLPEPHEAPDSSANSTRSTRLDEAPDSSANSTRSTRLDKAPDKSNLCVRDLKSQMERDAQITFSNGCNDIVLGIT